MIIDILEYESVEAQLEKIKEEHDEVIEAICEKSDEEIVNECWDNIKALQGLIWIKTGNKHNFIESYNEHDAKMEHYNKIGRVKFVDRVIL